MNFFYILSIALFWLAGVTGWAQNTPKLLPFQGHLTKADGSVLADGSKVVQFKIYDAPVSGTAVWAGEVHKLSVNAGLVNTILGSKTSLGAVDFDRMLYLEISIDANGDESITASDPPLLPRQVLLPPVFASAAGGLSYDSDGQLREKGWGAVFSNGDPDTGSIDGGKLAQGSVTSAKIQNQSIEREDLSIGVSQSIVPAGAIMAFAGSNIPLGWALCDGSPHEGSGTYAPLFQAIGKSWGNGGDPANSSKRFNLPDLRGRFLRGVDRGAGNDPDVDGRISETGGNAKDNVGSIQEDAIGSHVHDLGGFMLVESAVSGWGTVPADPPATTFKPTPRMTEGNQGAKSDTRPKNAYVNYIIKL